ncbi:MAG TPA: response regulator [Noviherbaspirillum sp.]|jgi:signal transduction histidine kinase|uniref:ATP-binding response regulator n=1 Tax=Noviherbaspirillum sp. TaxID=1926288 RepID=UPI002DDCBC38|nr:response regulator [Noviherbaspirillum sp.]HEV2609070.1 response regulator [Noviherbaspirillum sp.]
MEEKIRILLVDDNPDDRELARRAVSKDIPQAIFAEAGTAVDFERLINEPFDCTVTDFRLGWSDGITVLKRLKEKYPDRPVIMFTNTGSEETCALGMKLGLSDYIVKRKEEFPKLPAAVKTALALATARREAVTKEMHIRDLLERERFAREEAVRANRLKDEFLATVSHELRTPLGAILGWAHMLQLDRLTREQEKEAFAVIERNARAQAKLIDDLLDMSRIISGTLRIDLGPMDILSALRSSIDAVQPLAAPKSIRITLQLDPMPPPIRGDVARIQQVISNLLTNAVKFTPENGTIQVSLERVASSMQISVKDSGIGIDPAFLPYMFDRFRQSDTGSTRRHGGLGIGLSVVKSLVEMHGGTVSAFSEGLGKGARFSVRLPVAVMREQDVQELENTRDGSPAYDGLKGMRVLAVDDDADTLHVIQRVLSVYGANVVAAGSAAQALQLLAAEAYDVLLSDIGMPEEDGFSLIEKVRTLPGPNRDIPACSVTAFARGQDRERALLAGFDTHLVKPVEPGELIAVVLSLTKRPGRRQD